MKDIITWVVSNIAWMMLVYYSTRIYYHFKKRPAHALNNLLGSILSVAAAVIAVEFLKPENSATPGTLTYYIMFAFAALAGPGLVGLSFLIFNSEFNLEPDENHWSYQVAMPFYILGILFFIVIVVLGALILIFNGSIPIFL